VYAIFHDACWKTDQDFMIVTNNNFLAAIHSFQDNVVLWQAGYDVIMISPPGDASGDFFKGLWKSDHDILIVIHSNVISAMHGFRGKRICQSDMTSSSVLRQGALHEIVRDGLWLSDHDFLIALHSNFLSGMHVFRDNEVLLQTGYDVIVISPPRGVSRRFFDGIWKSDPSLIIVVHWYISHISYRFGVIRHFILAG